MKVSSKAIEYFKEIGAKKVRISLYFECSIKVKIDIVERSDDVKDVEIIVDDDAEPLLEGLMLDYDDGLYLRPEI